MKKRADIILYLIFIFAFCSNGYSQNEIVPALDAVNEGRQIQSPIIPEPLKINPKEASGRITLDFKEADIKSVLKVLALKSGVNIVSSPEVSASVTIKLTDVPWKDALKVILSNYGYAYEQRENIIMVAPLEKLAEQKKQEVELSQVQPTLTEVFNLKYIDAGDAKKAIESLLSARGEVAVLESTGQAGWEFGSDDISKRRRVSEGRISRSKTLIITDTPGVLDKTRKIISDIDIKPQQVLIETRIIEANKDRLRDIGLDWGTGSTGASDTSGALSFTPAGKNRRGENTSVIAGHALGGLVSPSIFSPKSDEITTANTGLRLAFRKLSGAQFETVLHALEEDVHTNTLSAPRILTLNNQEASILVGEKYPIIKTDISTETGQITGATLDKYQDIGIQLNVVPQISDDNYINMIIHPAVTSINEFITVKSDSGAELSQYPRINTREAETQILIKDGETVVIGGLLKDVKSRGRIGVPFLSSIPVIGLLFQRRTDDTEKVDLLIFITARIIKEGEFSDAYIATLEERLSTLEPEKNKKKAKKSNKT